jgi:hypothetical protein
MTPKEKAEELFNKFNKVEIYISIEPRDIECEIKHTQGNTTKQCALIAVDEILSMGIMSDSGDWRMAKSYWQEVKQEIEKL